MSAIFSPLYSLLFLKMIFAPILFKIFIDPVLEGLIFTFLTVKLDFFERRVRTIKKALLLMSDEIL